MSPVHNFIVEIADAAGAICQQECTVNVEPGCDGIDWIGDPAIHCRLRITSYVDGDFLLGGACSNCIPPPPCVPWDGTFSVRIAGAFPFAPVYYNLGAGFNSISGKNMTGTGNPSIRFDNINGWWDLRMGCSAGDFWQGHKAAGINPVGIYTATVDIFGIGNVDIEAYHL